MESRPPSFFNFRGGLLSSLFLKGLKPTEIADLRHFEGFFEKSEESRPPLKFKNNGGLLSIVFL